jgi:hypothetical protein
MKKILVTYLTDLAGNYISDPVLLTRCSKEKARRTLREATKLISQHNGKFTFENETLVVDDEVALTMIKQGHFLVEVKSYGDPS